MKVQLFKPFLIVLVANLFYGSIWSQHRVSREIEKQFTVDKNDHFEIINKHGKIHIETHDELTLSLKAEIVSWDKDKEKAQKLLRNIEIEIDNDLASDNKLKVETKIPMKNVSINDKEGFEVNYFIRMPLSMALDLSNRFGNTYLSDFNAKLKVDQEYGKLKSENLNGRDVRLQLKFGGADIRSLQKGQIVSKYSDVLIDKAEKLKLEIQFGSLSAGKIDSLDIISKYSKVKVANLGHVSGGIRFGKVDLDKLRNSMDLDIAYCNQFDVMHVEPGFKMLVIDGEFSTIDLNFPDSAFFDFNVNTKFGDLSRYPEKIMVIERRAKSKYTKDYQYIGTYGKEGRNKAKVNISSSYGNVRFNR